MEKKLHIRQVEIIMILKIDLMSPVWRRHFLQDVFQMTAIALIWVINPYHFNGLYLFWDSLFIRRPLRNGNRRPEFNFCFRFTSR